MASKRKTKKKQADKKTETAPKPAPAPTSPKPGMARKIEGLPFWKYKAQLMADRNIGLRDAILKLRRESAEQRGKMSVLTKLISEMEQQIADKENEIVGYETRLLDVDKADVQQGNVAITAELQIDPRTHDIQIVGESLILRPKPKEFRKK